MNTIEEWRAVLADEKYHSAKQQAELLLRSLDAYRPYTKVHDADVETIVRFLTARDEAEAIILAQNAEATMKRHAEMEERDEQRRREQYAGERLDQIKPGFNRVPVESTD